MLKDGLNSILDNIKERTTNPFLGTLIVVWIVHNWKLVYSLLYFDSKLSLDKRLFYIQEYFNKTPFYLNLVYVFFLTILVLCVTYLFLGLSRFISDFYEKIIIPKIVKFNDKGNIVLKSDYLLLNEAFRQLELRLEEERLAKVAAQNERDSAYSRFTELRFNEEQQENKKSGAKNNQFERVTSNIRSFASIAEINLIIQNIQSKKKNDPNDITIRTLLQEDFINLDPRTLEDGRYVFTDEGKKFIRYWNNNHS